MNALPDQKISNIFHLNLSERFENLFATVVRVVELYIIIILKHINFLEKILILCC